MELLGQIAIYALIGLFGLLGGFLLFSTLTVYSPAPVTELSPVSTPTAIEKKVPDRLSVLTWNVGYAGLDASEDFFMDGGTASMPASKGVVLRNIDGIKGFMASHEADFIFVQEIDRDSARSYGIDEMKDLTERLSDYEAWYATNFKVNFIPVPITHPMANVESGMLTMSKYEGFGAERYSFPGDYSWPVNLYQLKRCFIVTRYKAEGSDKDLVVVNLHLSAYDAGGSLRKRQLAFLRDFMTKEYADGNYVIVGGDWNNVMPGISMDEFEYTTPKKYLDIYLNLPEGWTPKGWTWAFDPKVPSLRSDEKPYVKGENFRTVIDGFVISPNVRLLSVKTYDLEFEYSDHNPVEMSVELGK